MADDGNPSDSSVIADMLDILPTVYATDDLDDTFARITRAAVAAVDACDFASVTTTDGRNVKTRAATDQTALAGDQLQYEEGEGPCLDAVTREQWVITPDAQTDQRWPRFSARLAKELNVHSMLSVRLATSALPGRNLGGLNLYSTRPEAFTAEQRDLGLLLAAVASVAADAASNRAEMVAAVQSRQVIGEAIGILRAQSDLSSEEAFQLLSQASQRMNVKLRDVAAQIARRPTSPGATARAEQT